MEKVKYSRITKFIATILLTISLSGFLVSLVLSMVYSEMRGVEGIKEDCYKKIVENYACAIINSLSNDSEHGIEHIDSLVEDSGFKPVVLIADTHEVKNIDLTDNSKYVYGSYNDIESGYEYQFWGVVGGSYYFEIDSAIEALTADNYCYNVNVDETETERYYIILGNRDEASLFESNLFEQTDQLLETVKYWGSNSVYFEIVFGILTIILAVYIFSACGHRPGDSEINLQVWDRIPFGIYTIAVIFLESMGGVGLAVLFEGFARDINLLFVIGCEICFAMAFFAIAYIVTIITRLKAKKFWRYTIFYHLLFPIRRLRSYAKENMSLFWRITLALFGILIGLMITGTLAWAMGWEVSSPAPVMLWILVLFILLAAIVYSIFFQQRRIFEGTKRIVEGKLDQPINTKEMFSVFKEHAENINSVGEGIERAVQEKMKSERFKTELITNVSHDIKTPLTSIINYVDLMKKEDIQDETILEYMEVLDRQSARLKKLIEDLMEASKASTGNLVVNFEECDVAVMLGQAVGEFEDKMEAKGIIPVVTYPEQPVKISADGRHLWRVFDNLLNNICKYAQPGTRVYINVDNSGETTSIIFKNISSSQLNISSDELMERFVRGDSSRNTEGSGLGLSIAKSLTELMKGQLKLDVDGDLFKVTLFFNTING